jgi:hypothetical protein
MAMQNSGKALGLPSHDPSPIGEVKYRTAEVLTHLQGGLIPYGGDEAFETAGLRILWDEDLPPPISTMSFAMIIRPCPERQRPVIAYKVAQRTQWVLFAIRCQLVPVQD